jgi:hypothetical protein
MATNPTRLQVQGCDKLAEALLRITEASRLDGKSTFDAVDLTEVAKRLAKASSAFHIDEIVSRALAVRCRSLTLRPGTADLILLAGDEIKPLEMLLLTDEALKDTFEKLEAELGEL